MGVSHFGEQTVRDRIRGLIKQSWASAQAREVPVGMDYRLLLWAQGPDDANLVLRYWDQLMVGG